MNFIEWFKLQEVGTGTGDVAQVKGRLFAKPVTRAWLGPWAEKDPFFKQKEEEIKDKFSKKFYDWFLNRTRLDEFAPVPTPATLNQPQTNQPTATANVNPMNYKGANKTGFQQAYQKFLTTKDPQIGNALYNAIQGNEQDLAKIQTGQVKPTIQQPVQPQKPTIQQPVQPTIR